MTQYQLEILQPSGEWAPYERPARSMTAATIVGLRLRPDRDFRVIPVIDPAPPQLSGCLLNSGFDSAVDGELTEEDINDLSD